MSHRELLPIPPIETATDPVNSAADLRQRWRALMGPLGFGQRLLWAGFVGANCCMYKTMSQVLLGTRPTRWLVENVMSRLRFVVDNVEEGATVAFFVTRPAATSLAWRVENRSR